MKKKKSIKNFFKLKNCIIIFNIFNIIYGQNDTIIINGNKFNYISKYNNGQIHELGNYIIKGKKNIKDGQWIIYNIDGTLFKQGTYRNGKKHGKWIEQDIDKISYFRGNYKNGKKHGKWQYENTIQYYRRGKLLHIRIIEYLF